MSSGSKPLAASRTRARSSVEDAIGPRWPTVPAKMSPVRLILPHVGLMPKTPQRAEGIRIDPPPSPPRANGTSPVATATLDPVDDPPATCPCPCGLRGITRFGLNPSGVIPYSVIIVVPRTIAPAARRRATQVASRAASPASPRSLPPRVGNPSTAVCSFTTVGTPSKGPRARPVRHRSVEAAASTRAAPSRASRMGPQLGLRMASARAFANASSTARVGVVVPALYASVNAADVPLHGAGGSGSPAPPASRGGRPARGRLSTGNSPSNEGGTLASSPMRISPREKR